MTEDITSLQIRVAYDSVPKADKALDSLTRTGKEFDKSTKNRDSVMRGHLATVARFAAGYVTVTTVINQFRAAIQTTREFQVLRASLTSATGSIEGMEKAWGALLKFASTTPYTLDQSVTAFTKLVNLGLTPSQRALTSYGDTAAAMGKDLMQMVEAVADATTGEFERLKEFGIKANKEGDTIKFRFRGVTTSIKNDAAAIEEYLISLGENNFAGNMAERMKTLDGQFANLEDSWNQFQYNLMTSSGSAEAFGGIIAFVSEQIQTLDAYITSGQFAAEIEGWRIAGEGFGQAWASVMLSVDETNRATAEGGRTAWDEFILTLQGIPPLVVAIVGEVATDFWTLVETAKAVSSAVFAEFANGFNQIKSISTTTFQSIKALAKGDVFNAVEGFKAGVANAGFEGQNATNETAATLQERLNAIDENSNARLEQINSTLADTIARQETAAATAELLRINAERETASANDVDLGRFKVAPSGGPSQISGALFPQGGGGASPKASGESFDALESRLGEEESSIEESYRRRLELIRTNTDEGSEHQTNLSLKLTDEYQKEALAKAESLKKQQDSLSEGYKTEEEIIKEAFERKKEIILSATELTEQERLKLLKEAEQEYTRLMQQSAVERSEKMLSYASDFFGNISQIAGAFGKKGSKIAKAAAIAETTVKTYQAATSAYASLAGIPVIGPALGIAAAGAAIAAGMANVARIRATDESGGYAGAYAMGGMIPSGKFGLVGEAGPELVQGPAMVTSAQATWDRRGAASSGGESNVEIKIINMSGEPVTEKRQTQGDKELVEIIVGQAKDAIANDISKGGGRVSGAIERTYRLSRGKRVG